MLDGCSCCSSKRVGEGGPGRDEHRTAGRERGSHIGCRRIPVRSETRVTGPDVYVYKLVFTASLTAAVPPSTMIDAGVSLVSSAAI